MKAGFLLAVLGDKRAAAPIHLGIQDVDMVPAPPPKFQPAQGLFPKPSASPRLPASVPEVGQGPAGVVANAAPGAVAGAGIGVDAGRLGNWAAGKAIPALGRSAVSSSLGKVLGGVSKPFFSAAAPLMMNYDLTKQDTNGAAALGPVMTQVLRTGSLAAPTVEAGTGALGRGLANVAGVSSKVVAPLYWGLEAGKEGYQDYQRGVAEGHNGLGAVGYGFKYRNDDTLKANENWSGAGGYLGAAAANAGKPFQSLVAGPREAARLAGSFYDEGTAGKTTGAVGQFNQDVKLPGGYKKVSVPIAHPNTMMNQGNREAFQGPDGRVVDRNQLPPEVQEALLHAYGR